MAFVTVFSATSALNGTDDGGGDGLLQLRQLINSAHLSSAAGTTCRITALFGTGCATVAPAITNSFFGMQDPSSNPYNFTGTQVQVNFGGSSNINSSAASLKLSDSFTLGEAWASSRNYIYSLWPVNNGAITFAISSAASQTGNNLYFQSVADDRTGQTAPAGTYTALSSLTFFIVKIEVDSTGATGAPTFFDAPQHTFVARKVTTVSY